MFGDLELDILQKMPRSALVNHWIRRHRIHKLECLGDLPLVFVWVWCPHIGLLRCGARRGKAQSFLNVLSDGHGAKDVEKDERTVGHIRAHEVPVRQTLKKRERYSLTWMRNTINCNHLLQNIEFDFKKAFTKGLS